MFKITSDYVIIFASTIKHNLENSVGEGKSLLFMLVHFSFQVFQDTSFVILPLNELSLAIILE